MNQKNLVARSSLCVIASAIFFSTYGVWSKIMMGYFGEFSQAWTRALLLLIILVPIGIMRKSFQTIRKQDIPWFLIISLSGGLNQAPYFYGFEHLSVGTATLLFYLMLTIGTFIIGALFFHEKFTSEKYISLGLSVVGLGILYKFSLSPSQILPAISTMAAGFMGASGVVFSKKLSSRYSETQILTSLFIVMLLSNGILSILFKEQVPLLTFTAPWFAQFGYTGALVIANSFAILGFKYLEPSVGGILGLLEVVFAAVLGVVLFQENVTPQLFLGSICIIFAAAYVDLSSFIKHTFDREYPPDYTHI
ncbi:MAG: EamA family transporter [Candidatus Pacebacteria bacterium]|nr:EamA family transporter [Candidatus Paceibacterota bacterium]